MYAIFALLFWFLPNIGHAAIALNGAVTDSVANLVNQSSITTSVVGAAGSDRLMVVCVQSRTSGATSTVSGVTFNGVAMTEAIANSYTPGPVYRTGLWYLVAPDVTTANVVVTWSNALTDEAQGYSVLQFTGVAQSGAVNATAIGSGNGTTASAVVTTTASDTMIVDCAMGRDDGGLTVGAGQTSRTDRLLAPAGVNDGAGVSTAPKAAAGAETMDWTQTTQDWITVAAAFNASGGAETPTSSSGTATLTWTNGTDTVGVTGANIRRCTGTACTATTPLTAVSASNGSAGTYVDRTIAVDTTYGYSVNNYDAAGNQSAYTSTVYTTTNTMFRTVLASDTFVRANSTDLGANWDAGYDFANKFQIISNAVNIFATSTDSIETYNAISTPNDQWISMVIPSITGLGTDSYPGLIVRSANSPTSTAYHCKISGALQVQIEERTGGAPATLTTAAVTAWQSGDLMRCEAEGTALRLYRVRAGADELLASTTDATLASGKVGLYNWSSVAARYVGAVVIGGFSATRPVAPTIASLALDATGATLTYGATTPTTIRVTYGNNAGTVSNVVVEPISAFPAGRYTKTWPDGSEFACFFPRDAQGIENTATDAYKCSSLVGIVQTLDTTPIVMTTAAPSGTLNQGTTGTTILVNLSKAGSCRTATTTNAYADLANAMTTVGLQASYAVTGLTNGSTTHYYVQCAFINNAGTLVTTSTALDITITVAAGAPTDSTAPSTLAGLTATILSQSQVELTVTAGTDNVAIQGYQFYVDTTGTCSGTYTPIATVVPATTIVTNLPPNQATSFVAKAVDTSQNYSAAYSNCVTVTTAPTFDGVPPSEPANLTVASLYQRSIVLVWTMPSDNSGIAYTIIESCTGVGCTNFSVLRNSVVGQSLVVSLAPATYYRFRITHSDQSGNRSATYSDIVNATTLTDGLDQPRLPLPYGASRLPRS
jgi:hypothetical protein